MSPAHASNALVLDKTDSSPGHLVPCGQLLIQPWEVHSSINTVHVTHAHHMLHTSLHTSRPVWFSTYPLRAEMYTHDTHAHPHIHLHYLLTHLVIHAEMLVDTTHVFTALKQRMASAFMQQVLQDSLSEDSLLYASGTQCCYATMALQCGWDSWSLKYNAVHSICI